LRTKILIEVFTIIKANNKFGQMNSEMLIKEP
jgi:hypothetical protein